MQKIEGKKIKYRFNLPNSGYDKKLVVDLKNKNDAAEVCGIIVGRGNEKFNINIEIVHRAKNTSARTVVKAVLYDSAQLNFKGCVKVLKGMSGCDSFLMQRTLVLGESVQVNSKPHLEIEENNVKCSHSVSISRPNEEEVFYLMSRGLDKSRATDLIAAGFLAS